LRRNKCLFRGAIFLEHLLGFLIAVVGRFTEFCAHLQHGFGGEVALLLRQIRVQGKRSVMPKGGAEVVFGLGFNSLLTKITNLGVGFFLFFLENSGAV
jgi:hypothetical protein